MTVSLRQVVRRFGDTPALHGITLDVPAGSFMAVLGPSGSGKSTLLRLVCGLDAPDFGRILIDGRDMDGVPARARRIGFVFQSYALFRHMTVAQNVAFGLRIRPRRERPHRTEIKRRTEELLALVQMPELGARYPHELSGGQRQRVALARALAIEPRVLLLDEPFGALDARVRDDLRRWLRELHGRVGLTTLFVTHDQEEAMALADRVALLNDGRLEQEGPPEQLIRHPVSAFAHAFLGETARFDCVVDAGMARFPGLPVAPVPTTLADGPAVAVVRLHEIGLRAPQSCTPPLQLRSRRASGAIERLTLALPGGTATLEVVQPCGQPLPESAGAFALDLSQAGIYRVTPNPK